MRLNKALKDPKGPKRTLRDPVRPSKKSQTGQAAFAASSFSSWFLVESTLSLHIQEYSWVGLVSIVCSMSYANANVISTYCRLTLKRVCIPALVDRLRVCSGCLLTAGAGEQSQDICFQQTRSGSGEERIPSTAIHLYICRFVDITFMDPKFKHTFFQLEPFT